MQLGLFNTGIVCCHCGKDPGIGVNNGNVWNGFRDADTDQFVCWQCKSEHYEKKRLTEHSGKYSELPVVIETEKLIRSFKK